MDLDAVAVELHLVHPAFAGGHYFGRDGIAGLDGTLRRLEVSAVILRNELIDDNARQICDELERRGVPFVFFTGQADAASPRWRSIPIVEKPAMPEAIVGAIKYAISADKRDILSSKFRRS